MQTLASNLAGRQVVITCNAGPGYEGETWPIRNDAGLITDFYSEIWLAPRVCRGIDKLLQGKYNYDLSGDYLETLVHEAFHIRLLSADEGLVECTALRNLWSVLTSLGIRGKVRDKLYRGAVFAHGGLPNEYRTVC